MACYERDTNMTIMQAVTQRILSLCRERNMTVNMLATVSGVTQSTINDIVNENNQTTTISTIQKICDGLEITITEFFTDTVFLHIEHEIR